MKWSLAGLSGLLFALVLELYPAPADACGLKLTAKTSSPRKVVARSSNPSHLLLIGNPPPRLERELKSKGHDVEVTSDTSDAKRKSYDVVMVADSSQVAEARSTFGNSVVVVRTGNVPSDVRSVENQVARTPVRADESREVVAARVARRPVAAGPTVRKTREVVTAKPAAEPVAAAVDDERVAAATPAPVAETRAPAEKRPAVAADARPRTEAKAATVPNVSDAEIFFSTGSAGVRRTAALSRLVRRMTAHPDVSVVIAGHADPVGNPDSNMALSLRRAEAVRDHLVDAGIDASRLEVTSHGDTQLKYGRTDGRNRRVSIEPKP